MSVIAFLYEDYYCHGARASFRGEYKDAEEVTEVLVGSRYVLVNLEVMNLDTLAWTRYKWRPLYEHDDSAKTLTHRWDKKMPTINLEWDGDVRKYGPNQIYYDAGEWERA